MSHYFEYDPTLSENKKIVNFSILNEEVMVVSDKGTFSKYRVDLGTRIFINTLISLPIKGNSLDLGSGNGVIGISIKKIFKEVDVEFSDINPKCVELTKESLKLNNLNCVCYQSDGFENIDKTYDYIFLNTPVSCGKTICYRLYEESFNHLNDGGKLLVVIHKKKGALSHKTKLEEMFSEVEVLEKDKGYYVISCKK